jgi:DNA-binding transcriptional regulator YiaG
MSINVGQIIMKSTENVGNIMTYAVAVTSAAEWATVEGMSPTQCRAGRAILDWSQPRLAEAAGVGLSTVVDFERERRTVSAKAKRAIRLALENAGIEMINESGVRLI